MSVDLIEHTLTICGREYRLRCQVEDEDSLLSAASILNEQVAVVRKGNGHLSSEQSVVLAALYIAQMKTKELKPELELHANQLNELIQSLQQRAL